MGIGLSGMISGLDTDAIVKAMVGTQTTKKEKIEGNISMNKWKSEAWSGLNKKIYNFYTSFASKLRLKSSYMTKSATSSDEKAVKVSATSSAAAGSHTLEVKALASSQYVTGAKLSGTSNYTTASKLSAIDPDLVGTTITIKGNAGSDDEKEVELKVTETTSIADFTAALKKAGLTASYDTAQKRFFISSADSGTDNKFTITSSKLSDTSTTAFQDIAASVDSTALSSEDAEAFNKAIDTLSAKSDLLSNLYSGSFDYDTATEDEQQLYDAINTIKTTAMNQQAAKDAKESVADMEAEALKNGSDIVVNGNTYSVAEMISRAKANDATLDTDKADLDTRKADLDAEEPALATYDDYILVAGNESKTREEYDAAVAEHEAAVAQYETDKNAYDSRYAAAVKTELYKETDYSADYAEEVSARTTMNKSTPTADMEALEAKIDGDITTMTSSKRVAGALSSLGLGEIDGTAKAETTDASGNKSMVVVAASDSQIVLDGATIDGTGNTISVNGLTIDVIAETSEPVTIGVTKDTDSIYKTIKEAFTEYNKLLDEMNELYYADSARSYKPLTDDQKEEMSDKEVEDWENKIKSALLRNDSSLGSLLSAMRTSLQGSVTTSSGNTYSLASFGISTGVYTERGKLHIYGDSDDNTYATYDDRLKKALADNPEDVMEALSGIFGNLYTAMTDKCAKTTLSSALTFYNDKQYKTELTSYEKQLSTMEDKIAKLEERYYKQFTAMEKAMATLQSQTSSLANMLGTNQSSK